MICKVCARETEPSTGARYCEVHQKAYENLKRKFTVWQRASNIDWQNYLKEVARNPFTGAWAKQVAEDLLADKAQAPKRNT